MANQLKWQSLLAPILAQSPFELVGVEVLGGKRHTTLRIYIDKPGGITIDDITRLSRQISVVLDVENPIVGAYTLEVSSPGLDRPLYSPKHFQQQVGQKVMVKVRIPVKDRHQFTGLLTQATEQLIQLDVEGQLFTFAYSDIEKARVVPKIEIGKGGEN